MKKNSLCDCLCQGERSKVKKTWPENTSKLGEGSYHYQLPGNGVTEVSAIRFLTKDFQYSFFEGFLDRGI